MDKKLTIGKLRGLQQLSNSSGIFVMCAMDHRDSLKRQINREDPKSVSYETMVRYKQDLAEYLGPESTAILLDPLFGAAQAIAGGVLSGQTSLLVSVEESGYESDQWGRVTTLLDDWGPDKVKRMGATAVKILLYYRGDLTENAAYQRNVITQVAKDCADADIPFLLEPLTYPATEEEKDPAIFASHRPGQVIEAAQHLTPLGIEVLKTEFPANLRYEKDEGKLRAICDELDAASLTPWVLLSGGVTFDEFALQVKIASQAGSSGFLGGRAIWDEAITIPDAEERRRWLTTTGVDRVRKLRDIAGEFGKPWWKKWTDDPRTLADVSPEWYTAY